MFHTQCTATGSGSESFSFFLEPLHYQEHNHNRKGRQIMTKNDGTLRRVQWRRHLVVAEVRRAAVDGGFAVVLEVEPVLPAVLSNVSDRNVAASEALSHKNIFYQQRGFRGDIVYSTYTGNPRNEATLTVLE